MLTQGPPLRCGASAATVPIGVASILTSSRQISKAASLLLARTTRCSLDPKHFGSSLRGKSRPYSSQQLLSFGSAAVRVYSTGAGLQLIRGTARQWAGPRSWSSAVGAVGVGRAGMHSVAAGRAAELRHGWRALWEAWVEGSRGGGGLPPALRTVGAISLACARSNVAARAFAVVVAQSWRSRVYAEPLFPGMHINSRAAPPPSPLWAAIKAVRKPRGAVCGWRSSPGSRP